MGDASKIVENEIIYEYNLENIDILKVGHHGSNTSTGEDFINYIKPKYSIISVGFNNRYGHPSNSVINILNKYNSEIYMTSTCGSIKFYLNKDLIECAI